MCGITGFFAFNPNAKSTKAKILLSNQKLVLRGPDNGNIFSNEQVALGHRRLSIIDISDNASQPMFSKDKRYIIIFNGEIFNYKVLSKQYLKTFWEENGVAQSNSDTEVLLYLLIKYGHKCLEWLQGFFAFSFYDTQTEQMIIARDALGKKPLHYYVTPNSFAFASEMKALMEWDVPKKINYTILLQYLQQNYIAQPECIIEGVLKLKPGHYMVVNKNGVQKYESFYQLNCQPSKYSKYTYEEAQKVLVDKLDASVQNRLISDVPLGAFLSGGIDSSVIVALASRHTSNLNTFSIGYKDNKFFDETQYAQLVAKKYKTKHEVFSLSNNDFLEHLFGVLDYIDEPYADSSALPLYILAHQTKKHVTVALSGDGADEIFSGYNKHAAEWKIRNPTVTNTIVKSFAPIWSILPHSRNNKITNLFRQLNRFAEGAKLSSKERYWRWSAFLSKEEAVNLLTPTVQSKINNADFEQLKSNILSNIKSDDFNEVLLTDVNLVLLSDMLVKVDMMSMANSLEVRSPFLDKSIVDFAFSIPSSFKVDASMKKKIVQDAFRNMLPQELYNRPKHGFEIPLLDWFRNELWGLINDDLLEDNFVQQQQIFNLAAIKKLKVKLKSNNPEDSHATIWALIVFQYWWKKNML